MKTKSPSGKAGRLFACSSLVRRCCRGALARLCPSVFARWVNNERCWIKVNNDPSGMWHVEIGVKHPAQSGSTLGLAMYRAFMLLESDPEWQWTTDYLRSIQTPNDQALPQPADSERGRSK